MNHDPIRTETCEKCGETAYIYADSVPKTHVCSPPPVSYTTVTEEVFEAFVENYGSPLSADVNRLGEPEVLCLYDWTLGESAVGTSEYARETMVAYQVMGDPLVFAIRTDLFEGVQETARNRIERAR